MGQEDEISKSNREEFNKKEQQNFIISSNELVPSSSSDSALNEKAKTPNLLTPRTMSFYFKFVIDDCKQRYPAIDPEQLQGLIKLLAQFIQKLMGNKAESVAFLRAGLLWIRDRVDGLSNITDRDLEKDVDKRAEMILLDIGLSLGTYLFKAIGSKTEPHYQKTPTPAPSQLPIDNEKPSDEEPTPNSENAANETPTLK